MTTKTIALRITHNDNVYQSPFVEYDENEFKDL